MTTYKILVVGAEAVGKTTYIRRHQTGEFMSERMIHGKGVTTNISFYTTRGLIVLSMRESDDILDSGFDNELDGLLAMYDLTRPHTKQVAVDAQKVRALSSVLVGNKADLVNMHHDDGVVYIYSKTNYHYEIPIINLIRKLTGDATVNFIDCPPITPPLVTLRPRVTASSKRIRIE